VFADIPLEHVLLGLDVWLKHQEWPPQASQLRREAIRASGHDPDVDRELVRIKAELDAIVAGATQGAHDALPE
jgi:hypothetical protein